VHGLLQFKTGLFFNYGTKKVEVSYALKLLFFEHVINVFSEIFVRA
jgi:hypothetical protein